MTENNVKSFKKMLQPAHEMLPQELPLSHAGTTPATLLIEHF